MRAAIYMTLAVAAVSAVSCAVKDESQPNYENRIYLSGDTYVDEARIHENETTVTKEISVSVAKPEDFDINISFRTAPELLDTYREGYYTPEARLLPAENCGFASLETVIEAGRVKSEPLSLDFVALDRLDPEKVYVLPLTISSSEVTPLPRAKTVYYVFKEASLVNVVAGIGGNCAWPEWGDFTQVSEMSSFTMEALVNAENFRNESKVATIMGIEDVFLIRVGDVLIPSNQLQVAYGVYRDGTTERGSITNSSMALKTNRWYHIAVTFDRGAVKVYIDGMEKASGSTASMYTKVNFMVPHSDESDGKPRCFWIGYSYDDKRPFNGMVSEVRVWDRALSAEEIQKENHFYQVSPDSEGLVAYWKFDDGEGNTVRDHSIYGHDLTAAGKLRWIPVELPEK